MTVLLAYQGKDFSVVGSDLLVKHGKAELYMHKISPGCGIDLAFTGRIRHSTGGGSSWKIY